ncbi:MAG: c-type cytochrome [Dissulfurispiraceae bacterium]
MKAIKLLLLLSSVVLLSFSFAVAAGDIEKGKILFNDPNFAGAVSGKSCSSCHPEGKGLDKAADKKVFTIMGKKQKSLEEAVNFCIEGAIKGKPIDPTSEQMQNIVSYIKSLRVKSPGNKN